MIGSLWMRRVTLTAHLGLIFALIGQGGIGSGSLLALPLLLPLPGLLRARPYTFAWASMLLTFYVAGFLSGAYAHPQTRVVSSALATLAAVDFMALILFVRFAARERTAQRAGSGDALR